MSHPLAYSLEIRFASGIIFCGTGVGGFIFPNILGRLLDQVVRSISANP